VFYTSPYDLPLTLLLPSYYLLVLILQLSFEEISCAISSQIWLKCLANSAISQTLKEKKNSKKKKNKKTYYFLLAISYNLQTSYKGLKLDGAISCDINLWITRSKISTSLQYSVMWAIIGYEILLRFVHPPNVLVSARWELRISTKAKSWSLFVQKGERNVLM